MLANKLARALEFTTEEHNEVFERFANSFLLPDYPELEGLGAKKDKGMDARIVAVDGRNEIVIQSCVSPAKTARTKVLATWGKLHENPPHTLVYCTPSKIGLSLDVTKKELRTARVSLQVCDATWFVERVHSTESRSRLSDSFSQQILHPLLEDLQPSKLYSEVLSDLEEMQIIRYLELHSRDRQQGRNLTKTIFEAFVLGDLHETSSGCGLTQAGILENICRLFPEGHHSRIHQIVPPRLLDLKKKGDVVIDKAGHIVLSESMKTKLQAKIISATESELMFRANISRVVRQVCEENEIDYAFNAKELEHFVHSCILWYMREQGRQIQNPIANLVNILNTEELVTQFLKMEKPSLAMEEIQIMDIAPSAIFQLVSSGDSDILSYLRSKSDIFVAQAFLQSTPDIQKACKKLFGRDVIYVDTTAIIHCTAELYDQDSPKFLMKTLETARNLGIRIKTFRPFMEEFVAHLRGPVLLEWQNHLRDASAQQQEARLEVSPRLIEVFVRSGSMGGPTIEQIVSEILGDSNQNQNATDFIQHEFGIAVEDIPKGFDKEEHAEWELVFGHWLEQKRRYGVMDEQRFELLVRNDVNAYTAVKRLRRSIKVEGTDYGFKIWLLTMDRMYWRIVRSIGKENDFVYHVAMSMDYLANFIATLASLSQTVADPVHLPSTLVSQVGAYIPSQLRDEVAGEFAAIGRKRYVTQRRIRELVREAKSNDWDLEAEES